MIMAARYMAPKTSDHANNDKKFIAWLRILVRMRKEMPLLSQREGKGTDN